MPLMHQKKPVIMKIEEFSYINMGCLFTYAAAGGVGGLGGLGDGKHHVVTEGLAVGPGND